MRSSKLSLVVALLAAVAVFIVPQAGAQGGLTYTSSIQVQNLDNVAAPISIEFYDEATGALQTGAVIGATIPAGGSVTYLPIPNLSAGFKGSAVISSANRIAAITNLLGNGGAYGGAANGLSAGSTSVGMPLIMRNNSGFSTFFSVQNAGTADATVTIAYKRGTHGQDFTSPAFTIKPGASKSFDQATMNELGDKFIGSATITSDQPVVSAVSQLGTGGIKTMLMYDGFAGGSTTVRAPLVMSNNSGFFTSLSIQNVGTAATAVNVTYSPNTARGSSFQPVNETLNLQPGAGGNILQASGQWGNGLTDTSKRYIGSATITASQPVEVVVNQNKFSAASNLGTAYEGFNPASLTSTASAPLVMTRNGNYSTAIQCQNAGTAPTTITVTYSANTAPGGSGTPAADTATIQPGASATIFQAGNDPKWGARYIGGATITATGNVPIGCLVNELNTGGSGDSFLTYTAINY